MENVSKLSADEIGFKLYKIAYDMVWWTHYDTVSDRYREVYGQPFTTWPDGVERRMDVELHEIAKKETDKKFYDHPEVLRLAQEYQWISAPQEEQNHNKI